MVDDSNKGQSPFDEFNGDDSIPNSSSVSRRLSEILLEESDGDLLLQTSERDGFVLQWLNVLNVQVIGACRVDERLKPLLKVNNVSNGVAEDCLLSHLSQHFEPSEVGLLARCLCMPLVSIRVGKINKKGMLLTPTSIRGNLCLTLLPTSDLRLLFNGDDGSIERLATLSPYTDVDIEEMSADKSGRSFLVKTSADVVSYFWCSEKSKLLGDALLGKMKDLLSRKPSLAEVTGISDSRLNCFATHLRAYLAGSSMSSNGVSETTLSSEDSFDSSDLCLPQSSFSVQEGSSSSSSLHLDSLPEYLSPTKPALSTDNVTPASSTCIDLSISNRFEIENPIVAAALNFSDVLGTSLNLPESQFYPSISPQQLSPHYCWCPPVVSAMQLPISFAESPTLPPLSSLLSSAKPSLHLSDLPPFDFPSRLPELPTSQQILTFTPLMCDPIVHIPVIDICSSGQGYLVSAGPAISISTTIPPNLVDPLLSSAESMVEKGARETLRMLIGSSNQPKPRLLEVLPSVFNSGDDMQNVGGRGLYNGMRDLDANRNIMTSMGFFLSEKSSESGDGKRCDLSNEKEKPSGPGPESDAGEY